jgi:hypothetical protein
VECGEPVDREGANADANANAAGVMTSVDGGAGRVVTELRWMEDK